MAKRTTYQTGGVAKTAGQQFMGLNDQNYNTMQFPGNGMRTFRGLDSGQPVQVTDQKGKTQVLYGPQHQDRFYGDVYEQRLWSPKYGGFDVKQTGGRVPIYVSDPHDPRLQAYNDSLKLYNSYEQLKDILKKSDYSDDGKITHKNDLLSEKQIMDIAEGRDRKENQSWWNKGRARYDTDAQKEGNLYKAYDFYPEQINKDLGYQYFSDTIKPQSVSTWENNSINPLSKHFGDARLVYNYANVHPQQPIIYQPQESHLSTGVVTGQPVTADGRWIMGPQNKPANHNWKPEQRVPTGQPNQLPTNIEQQQQQSQTPFDFRQEVWQSPNGVNGKLVQPAGFYKQDNAIGQGFQFGGNLNNNIMAKKGYSVPGYKYGGSKLGGMAIIPDNNPWSAAAEPVPVKYMRAQNGMMQMGGSYLDYMGLNPTLAGMQYGGGTRDYSPVNQDNASIMYDNDKRGYNAMSNPGHHWTNEGWRKSTVSTNNGASFSKFGGPTFQPQMPAPLEYAYLANGGMVDKYNSGGFAQNGSMI